MHIEAIVKNYLRIQKGTFPQSWTQPLVVLPPLKLPEPPPEPGLPPPPPRYPRAEYRRMGVAEILSIVCFWHSTELDEDGFAKRMRKPLNVEDVVGQRRFYPYVLARRDAIYAVRRRFPQLSFPRMSRFFGGRHHSSILWLYRAKVNRILMGID